MAEKSGALTPSTEHPDFTNKIDVWSKVRDCLEGEEKIKLEKTKYLPQPEGMKGKYASAYTAYIERAHFPLICSYALQAALGVLSTKLPEFKVPKKLEYIKGKATKDGLSISALFLNTIVEIYTTGRVPCLIDMVTKGKGRPTFCFVPYKAEDFINWKVDIFSGDQQRIHLGVFKEKIPDVSENYFSHDTKEQYRALVLKNGVCYNELYKEDSVIADKSTVPKYMGKELNELPIVIAGSINNSYDIQMIPLLSVANCSIQIYRKEADLANSEFLSCNPTLVFSGADDDETPNVVGSSVAIYLADPQARVYYTKTDTQALTHVKEHIGDLYEEAIRHGIALLEGRKGVEAAEALRIRQSIQVATVYSVYQSAMNMILEGLKIMCRWSGLDESEVQADAPQQLTQDIADSSLLKELIEGFLGRFLPLEVVYKYVSDTGLIEPTVNFNDYKKQLIESNEFMKQLKPEEVEQPVDNSTIDNENKDVKNKDVKKKKAAVKK